MQNDLTRLFAKVLKRYLSKSELGGVLKSRRWNDAQTHRFPSMDVLVPTKWQKLHAIMAQEYELMPDEAYELPLGAIYGDACAQSKNRWAVLRWIGLRKEDK
jgi:hypothetical protein